MKRLPNMCVGQLIAGLALIINICKTPDGVLSSHTRRRKRGSSEEFNRPAVVRSTVEVYRQPLLTCPEVNGDYDVPRHSHRANVGSSEEVDRRPNARWTSSSSSSAGLVSPATTMTSVTSSATGAGRHRYDSSPGTTSPTTPCSDRQPFRSSIRIHVDLMLQKDEGSINDGCLADRSLADSIDELQHAYDVLPA